jgi:prolactin regulatory element-binding protein
LQRLYHVGDDRTLNLIDELELEKDEDAPMSMAAHPEVSPSILSRYTTTDLARRTNNSYAGLTVRQLKWRRG